MTPCIPAWNTPRVRASAWAAAATWVVALLGGLATDIGPWCLTLRQPAWKPPYLWFGPAWTLIYTRTAVAGVRVWEATPQPGLHRRWLAMLAMLASGYWHDAKRKRLERAANRQPLLARHLIDRHIRVHAAELGENRRHARGHQPRQHRRKLLADVFGEIALQPQIDLFFRQA